MIENIKPITNSLTIIAVFAGIADIAGTVAVSLVPDSMKVPFTWFVILFPVLLVILFFTTLNFNNKVLYAPSDFKDEKNFLDFSKVTAPNQKKDLSSVEQANEIKSVKSFRTSINMILSYIEFDLRYKYCLEALQGLNVEMVGFGSNLIGHDLEKEIDKSFTRISFFIFTDIPIDVTSFKKSLEIVFVEKHRLRLIDWVI